MSPYAWLGLLAGWALWTGAVAYAVWSLATALRQAEHDRDRAEVELHKRDLDDSKAETAEWRQRAEELKREQARIKAAADQAIEEIEARARAGQLGLRDPDAAVGVLLGGDSNADGGPPGGAGGAASPPGPTT